MNFFFGGQLKDLVHETPIDSKMDLVERTAAVAGTLREIPDVFENV